MKKSQGFKVCNNCGNKSERNSLMGGGPTLPPEYFGSKSGIMYSDKSNHQGNESFGNHLSITNKNFRGGSYTRRRVSCKSKKTKRKSSKSKKSRKMKKPKSKPKSKKKSKK